MAKDYYLLGLRVGLLPDFPIFDTYSSPKEGDLIVLSFVFQ